jgi:alpha-tubulin suppressor-like RCC1 family protein
VGTGHTCARDERGAVFCWGGNATGQLGDGTQVPRDRPVRVPIRAAASIGCAAQSTCAALRGGEVACWGANQRGQLGRGSVDTDPHPQPQSTLVLHSGVLSVDGGAGFHCARLVGGAVYCWGRNDTGQRGGPGNDSATPVAVEGVAEARTMSVGGAHACVVQDRGALVCWGANDRGQRAGGGLGGPSAARLVPGLGPVTSVAAGDVNTCVGQADGGVRCFGGNNDGQNGDGSELERLSPVEVAW